MTAGTEQSCAATVGNWRRENVTPYRVLQQQDVSVTRELAGISWWDWGLQSLTTKKCRGYRCYCSTPPPWPSGAKSGCEAGTELDTKDDIAASSLVTQGDSAVQCCLARLQIFLAAPAC